jgi:hypothetical protein
MRLGAGGAIFINGMALLSLDEEERPQTVASAGEQQSLHGRAARALELAEPCGAKCIPLLELCYGACASLAAHPARRPCSVLRVLTLSTLPCLTPGPSQETPRTNGHRPE